MAVAPAGVAAAARCNPARPRRGAPAAVGLTVEGACGSRGLVASGGRLSRAAVAFDQATRVLAPARAAVASSSEENTAQAWPSREVRTAVGAGVRPSGAPSGK
ncbi:hypothetical protein PAPYR_12720 [Paratrimastix pyriformis]|uniref:Uncharacterized protein n=1 Tax=Paratrimastix pyriformis TaxID=342808 RepID=A0ABQ8U6J2_9EUKA|nr:hypothetical protein PAPYR_12720 [Paratrimastix pyriformis]